MHLPSLHYEDLFRYRSVWMGIAILWVVLYHSSINLEWLAVWKSYGYGGVDIFFFASGLGCYYSLQKQSNPAVFLKKRLLRILPSYYLVLALWLALQIFLLRTPITGMEILTNIFCTGIFSMAGNQFNWYMSAVWPSYLVAPFLVCFVNRVSRAARIFLLLILLLWSTTFLPTYWSLMLFATRLPIFYAGILFAKAAQSKETMRLRSFLFWILLAVIGASILRCCDIYSHKSLTDFGLWWYPFLLIVPGLCFEISFVCLYIQRFCTFPLRILETIGNCSFELYLVHLTVFTCITYLIDNQIYQPNNTFWLGAVLFCCLLAICLHTVVQRLVGSFTRQV